MAETSNYISIPNSDNSDVITLNILTMPNNGSGNTNSSTTYSTPSLMSAAANVRPTTPTPPKRVYARKPENLHLKISSFRSNGEKENVNVNAAAQEKYQDTSTNTTVTSNNSTSTASQTPSTSSTTISSIFSQKQTRPPKLIDIGFDNIRYTARMGFFRRGKKVRQLNVNVLLFYNTLLCMYV